jgi:hypothetical protein
MIRPFTLITMVMAMVSGAYLFAVKHRAQVLDDQLAAVTQGARLDEQRIRVLQAQWALEIDPNRLTYLASKFSQLQPMKPEQLVTLTALPGMLPPAGSPAPSENPTAPQIADIPAPQTAAPASDALVAMLPMPPPEAPDGAAMPAAARGVPSPASLRTMLAGKTAAVRTVRLASVTRRNTASHLAHSEWAANLPPPRPLYTQTAANNAPMGAQVMTVSAVPAAMQDAGEAQGGSLLGMAADLAPPQPVAPGTGN